MRPACSGDVGSAGRVAELEAALQAAERDVGEAEAMAQEAMEMAEAAQVGGGGKAVGPANRSTWEFAERQ